MKTSHPENMGIVPSARSTPQFSTTMPVIEIRRALAKTEIGIAINARSTRIPIFVSARYPQTMVNANSEKSDRIRVQVLLNEIRDSSSGGRKRAKEHWRSSRMHAGCQTRNIVESSGVPALRERV